MQNSAHSRFVVFFFGVESRPKKYKYVVYHVVWFCHGVFDPRMSNAFFGFGRKCVEAT